MRKLLFIGLMALSPLAFAAQETRNLPAFNAIVSQGVYTLVVTAGEKQSVVITGDADRLAKLSTKVVGDELLIATSETKNHVWSEKLVITIGMPQLKKLKLEGVSETKLNQLTGESFELNYQGVGALTASGKVQSFILKAEGVGSLNARDLDAQHVDAALAGVGSATVRASDSLIARVEGVGSLTYFGKPARVNKIVGGIGSVRAGE